MRRRHVDQSSLRADLQPGWVPLDLDPGVDPDEWAARETELARRGVEPLPTSIGAEAAVTMLAAAVRSARVHLDHEAAAHLALAYMPDPVGRVYATLNALLLPFDDDVPTTPAAWLAALAAEGGSTVGRTEADEVDLKRLGPAARFRRLQGSPESLEVPAAVEDWPTEPVAASERVLEALTYVALPRGLDGFVHLTAVWDQLVLGDEITVVVDQLVATVRLTDRR